MSIANCIEDKVNCFPFLTFTHPQNPDWKHFSFCQFTEEVSNYGGILKGRSTVAIEPGKLDRSPCGTGCSARMALLHAQGRLTVGDNYIGESLIGSVFECAIEAKALVGDKQAIVPRVGGRAWITGLHQHLCDPDDPWVEGYKLRDTWGLGNNR